MNYVLQDLKKARDEAERARLIEAARVAAAEAEAKRLKMEEDARKAEAEARRSQEVQAATQERLRVR